MTSQQWQQQIDDVTTTIIAKEARLHAIAGEKATVITDNKRLSALEREEMALPADIEVFKRRLPILAQELAGALRDEAQVRIHELEQQGVEAATQVSAATQAIQSAMGALLARIAEAHDTWEAHGMLVSEAAYLRARFGVPPLRIANGNRLSGDERAHFVREYENLFRQPPPTPWDRLRMEWLETTRQAEEERRQAEDAKLPQIVQHIDYRDNARPVDEAASRVDEEAGGSPVYIHYADHLIGQGH